MTKKKSTEIAEVKPATVAPVNFNDPKAVAAKVGELEARILELESKLTKLVDAWGDPDAETGGTN